MTRWGAILLLAFFVLGLRSSIATPRAVRYVVWVTVVVIGVVGFRNGPW